MARSNVFISFSESQGDLSFSRSVYHEIRAITTGEIYYYPEEGHAGRNIDQEIKNGLGGSHFLLCLLNDQYFSNKYCLQELMHFVRLGKPRNQIIAILGRDLVFGKPAIETSQTLKAYAARKIMEADLSLEERQFAESEWLDVLADVVNENRRIDMTSEERRVTAVKLLSKTLVLPRTYGIMDYAVLAALCLGADRFRMGGWGHSLGSAADFDSADGDELPHGPYALSIIGLRALAKFLPKDELEAEHSLIYESYSRHHADPDRNPQERNPFKRVHDNLPEISRCLAALETGEMELAQAESYGASNALREDHRGKRWIFFTKEKQCVEYLATAFVCLRRLGELSNTKKQRITKIVGGSPQRLESVPLFSRTTYEFMRDELLKEIEAIDIDKTMAAGGDCAMLRGQALAWLLGSGEFEQNENPVAQKLGRHRTREIFQRQIEELAERVAGGGGAYDAALLTAILAECAVFARSGPDFRETAQARIEALFDGLVEQASSIDIVPRLDAVAWCSIIEIACTEVGAMAGGSPALEKQFRKLLTMFWHRGLDLRQSRVDFILKLKAANTTMEKEEALAGLDTRLQHLISDHLRAIWTSWSKEVNPVVGKRQADEATFIAALENASFGIRYLEAQAGNEYSNAPAGRICGTLRVYSRNNRIELDTPGYRRLFLEPFSRLSGIPIADLNDIRREFGDNDDDLVAIMGNLVVAETYAFVDDRLQASDFVARTADITDKLRKMEEDSGIGVEDLLRIRSASVTPDSPKHRWIHRTAILQKPQRNIGEPLISWRFAEIPEKIATFMTQEFA